MSLQQDGLPALELVTGQGESPDIPDGALFAAFAEDIVGGDAARIADARDQLFNMLGNDAVVDAAAVAALFNAINRVADAIGIQFEASKLERTDDFRSALNLDEFQTARFQQK